MDGGGEVVVATAEEFRAAKARLAAARRLGKSRTSGVYAWTAWRANVLVEGAGPPLEYGDTLALGDAAVLRCTGRLGPGDSTAADDGEVRVGAACRVLRGGEVRLGDTTRRLRKGEDLPPVRFRAGVPSLLWGALVALMFVIQVAVFFGVGGLAVPGGTQKGR